ncbi:MAG: secondary thiamine-phosphate synthase enzyme YjbQ [Oscillospiraceae bacterium]|jgi:secondary thiamine-phosphate synthase enzyme
MDTYNVSTGKTGLFEVTDMVNKSVSSSGIKEGLCVVYSPDTDAGIIVTASGRDDIHEDIFEDFERIFPAHNKQNFKGDLDEASAHSKSAVAGVSLDIAIHDGKAVIGNGQGVFIADYDGKKPEREFYVKCI